MDGSVNKVILIGNLGRDPEVRSTQGGNKIVNLSIATSESWTDKRSGERRDATEWNRVVIFSNGLADIADKYLQKGDKVYVEGKLQTRKWQDKSGQDRYSTEVALQPYNGKLVMLDSRRNGSEHGDERPQGSGPAGSPGDLDDEIPF